MESSRRLEGAGEASAIFRPVRGPLASLFGALLLVLVAVPAGAQTVVLRASAGYGFEDGYNAGFGGSAGIQFPFLAGRPWFVGPRVMVHSGKDIAIPESLGGTGESGNVSQVQYGLEFGATWVSSPVLVRTSGGIGIARISPDVPGLEPESKLLLGPGLILAVPVGDTFVGIEAKWLRVRGYSSAIALYGTAGVRLGR